MPDETRKYLDYVTRKLKEGRSFSTIALIIFANEKNLDIVNLLTAIINKVIP